MATSDRSEVVREEVEQFMQQGKDSMKILVIGKTGVGKSSLINSLCGKPVAEESDIDKGTHHVEVFREKVNSIDVEFWDSPGLHDAEEREKEYLQEIVDNCADPDLILYCTKLTDTRVTEEDCATICEFTRVFGTDFWSNAVFVLTFANDVMPRSGRDDPAKKKAFYIEKTEKLAKKLQQTLRNKAKLPTAIVREMPFVPVGYWTEELQYLPDGTHWFSGFWLACFTRAKRAAQPAVLKGYVDQFEDPSKAKAAEAAEAAASRQSDPPPPYPGHQYPYPKLVNPPPDPYYAHPHAQQHVMPMPIYLPEGGGDIQPEAVAAGKVFAQYGVFGKAASLLGGLAGSVVDKALVNPIKKLWNFFF